MQQPPGFRSDNIYLMGNLADCGSTASLLLSSCYAQQCQCQGLCSWWTCVHLVLFKPLGKQKLFFFLMALFKLRSVRETYDVESSETIKGETGKEEKTCVDQIVCGGVGIQTSYFWGKRALLPRTRRIKYCYSITLSLTVNWHEAVQRIWICVWCLLI